MHTTVNPVNALALVEKLFCEGYNVLGKVRKKCPFLKTRFSKGRGGGLGGYPMVY